MMRPATLLVQIDQPAAAIRSEDLLELQSLVWFVAVAMAATAPRGFRQSLPVDVLYLEQLLKLVSLVWLITFVVSEQSLHAFVAHQFVDED